MPKQFGALTVRSLAMSTAQPAKPQKQKAPSKPKQTIDPRHIAAARELRDRYPERFNEGMALPEPKYAA